MSAEARRAASEVARGMRLGAARAALRAFVRGQEDEGWALVTRAAGAPLVQALRTDPQAVERLLEALEFRVSPELDDDEDPDEVATRIHDPDEPAR